MLSASLTVGRWTAMFVVQRDGQAETGEASHQGPGIAAIIDPGVEPVYSDRLGFHG